MSRCELTGKAPLVKNVVSHSNIKTKRWVHPNVHRRRMYSEALEAFHTLLVSTHALRSIEHAGGLDTFITRQAPELLSRRALALQARIKDRLAGR